MNVKSRSNIFIIILLLGSLNFLSATVTARINDNQKTVTIPFSGDYTFNITINEDKTDLHVKYTCQGGCLIDFFLANDQNYQDWYSGNNSASGFVRNGMSSLDETFKLTQHGEYHLVWLNYQAGATSKTIMIEDISTNVTNSGAIDLFTTLSIIITIIASILFYYYFLRDRKSKKNIPEKLHLKNSKKTKKRK